MVSLEETRVELRALCTGDWRISYRKDVGWTGTPTQWMHSTGDEEARKKIRFSADEGGFSSPAAVSARVLVFQLFDVWSGVKDSLESE
ncbi:uncharacterized protein N7459_009949 [Penicillium hispanicum]|uniref:uncharacterized protein n=1 Tax=Penicillium hispanicum TaxID=1080232 RepID=UPI002541CD1B|nr:uncharacterized protein N7459_009949 [Penicillium hispanicum]KAJ5570519.1 hypothetical protein N7459_009949 [Penicillium hispanicum]